VLHLVGHRGRGRQLSSNSRVGAHSRCCKQGTSQGQEGQLVAGFVGCLVGRHGRCGCLGARGSACCCTAAAQRCWCHALRPACAFGLTLGWNVSELRMQAQLRRLLVVRLLSEAFVGHSNGECVYAYMYTFCGYPFDTGPRHGESQ
jgi:hypothetical protein